MKVLFVSSTCSNEKYDYIRNIRLKKILDPSQKFYSLLLEGLNKHNNVEISCLTTLPVSASTSGKKIWRTEVEKKNSNLKYTYMSFINGKFTRYFTLGLSSIANTIKWSFKNRFVKDKVIICDPLTFMAAKPARIIGWLFKIPTMAIVTDIPTMSTSMKQKKQNIIRKTAQILYEKKSSSDLKKYEAYIFIVDAMNSLINSSDKPYIVIEGSVDIKMKDRISSKKPDFTPKIVMYAGGIYEKFGLSNLVEAFKCVKIPNVELHIYGDGNYIEEVIKESMMDNRIKYLGVVSTSEIVEKEQSATLLVNPRPNDEEFTKYSFPSKTLEYMVSGTPVLTTRLEGIPKEYCNYLFYFDDTSKTATVEKLIEVLSIDDAELIEKGRAAKEFVIANKNNIKQADKILKFIETEVLCSERYI